MKSAELAQQVIKVNTGLQAFSLWLAFTFQEEPTHGGQTVFWG